MPDYHYTDECISNDIMGVMEPSFYIVRAIMWDIQIDCLKSPGDVIDYPSMRMIS